MKTKLAAVIFVAANVLSAKIGLCQFDAIPQTNLVPIQTHASFESKSQVERLWRISPKANHHNAVVRVEVPNGAGTGCFVANEQNHLLCLTNHHVVSLGWVGNGFATKTHARAAVEFNGSRIYADVIYANPAFDIAILHSDKIKCDIGLPIASANARIGERIEVAGYGGPTNEIRHFLATVIQTREAVSVDASVVSGDSGSPMLTSNGIVGVVYGAPNAAGNRGRLEGWAMTHPASSKINATTLCQIFRQVCPPQGCRPICQPAPIQQPPTNIQPEKPIEITNPITIEKPVAGPIGPAGPPGKDAVVDYDKLAEEVIKRLPPFYPQWIDADGNVIDEIKSGVKLGQTLKLRAEMIENATTE